MSASLYLWLKLLSVSFVICLVEFGLGYFFGYRAAKRRFEDETLRSEFMRRLDETDEEFRTRIKKSLTNRK